MPKGKYKRTKKYSKNLSNSLKGNVKLIKSLTGRKRSRKECEMISKRLRGRKLSKLHRKNISVFAKKLRKDYDDLGYTAKHNRIIRKYGKADKCENRRCENKSKRYEWANISGKYKESRKDWKKLCTTCHRVMDGYNRIFKIRKYLY